ncbi:MAG: Asp23/Gls24 family envelope stress response protein [Synergistes sp.]|nr:Asp23/Gls24 family envelope stress response protein [Synergistes sp.]
MAEQNNEEITAEEKNEAESGVAQANLEGKVRIAEEVIAQLVTKALSSVEGVSPANPGLMTNLRLGRKTANGVRISVSDGDAADIVVDTYISVKYGLRIPDVCWDVQEAVKNQIERFTGYSVKNVNVYVQGITFAEDEASDEKEEAN